MMAATTVLTRDAAPPLEQGLAAPLKDVLRDLTAPRRQIEGAFLDIGRCLVEGNSILGGITSTFENLAAGLEGSGASDTFGPFEMLAKRMLAMTDSVAGDMRDLGPLIVQVAAIRRPVNELQSAAKQIGLVALGTRISAAQLPGGHDFEAFTSDIMHLAERASATVSEFAAVYERLVATLRAAEAKRAAFEATQKRALSGLAEQLKASLNDAALRRQEAGAANGEIGELFGRIGAGVASIVTALQIGDITRQRIEHVEEGLAFLLDPAEDLVSAADGNQAALVAAVCRLQSAQATQATQDFEQEAGRVVEIIRQLATDAANIVVRSRRIHEETVKGSQAALTGLAEEVRKACSLMRECEAARTQLDHATSAVTVSLEELLRCLKAVQNIKGGMHIVGINMALKCAWLGPEGNTLNVIAHELRELAGTTVIHANTAVVVLNEAAARAQSLTATTDAISLADIDALEEEVRRAASLQQGDRRLAEALDLLVRDGMRVATLLEQAAGRITVQRDIGGAMRQAIARIDRIRLDAAAAHAAKGSGDMGKAEERALAQLKGRYTMASERVLHDQHAGLAGKGAPAQPSAFAAAEPDLDDIFL